MSNVEDLEVWHKAVLLSVAIYKLTKGFPAEERFGLSSQMQRCSVSIASNLAEGAGRDSRKDFLKFISIARGSALELKTQLIIAQKIGYCDLETLGKVNNTIDEITRMLSGLKRSLQHTTHNP